VANYKGTVQPEEVISVFEKYDIFLFPTKGENFGHVIYEALVGGCIPIISNTTPWLELEKNNCGRVCNLNDIDMFRNTIENYLSKNTDQLMEEKNNAIRYAKKKYEYSVKNSGYRKIWEKV
jgi:glycosyltransferase involved in cell wall biosynthesis